MVTPLTCSVPEGQHHPLIYKVKEDIEPRYLIEENVLIWYKNRQVYDYNIIKSVITSIKRNFNFCKRNHITEQYMITPPKTLNPRVQQSPRQ